MRPIISRGPQPKDVYKRQAMSIAGFSLWIGTFLIGQLTPWMLQNLTPAGTFLIFAGMCVPYILIIWKLVPETTGKSLEEIEQKMCIRDSNSTLIAFSPASTEAINSGKVR